MRATKETEILPYRGAPLSAFVKLNAGRAQRAECDWGKKIGGAQKIGCAPSRGASQNEPLPERSNRETRDWFRSAPRSLERNRSAALVVPFSNELRMKELNMGRYLLLWMLGIPLPLLALIWLLGGVH